MSTVAVDETECVKKIIFNTLLMYNLEAGKLWWNIYYSIHRFNPI